MKTGFILIHLYTVYILIHSVSTEGKRKKILDVSPSLVSLKHSSLVRGQGWPGAGCQQLLATEGA